MSASDLPWMLVPEADDVAAAKRADRAEDRAAPGARQRAGSSRRRRLEGIDA
jgi:hypothetical protein